MGLGLLSLFFFSLCVLWVCHVKQPAQKIWLPDQKVWQPALEISLEFLPKHLPEHTLKYDKDQIKRSRKISMSK